MTAGQHNSTSISCILHRKSRIMRLSTIFRVKKLVFGAFLVFFVLKWAVVPLYSAMKRFVHWAFVRKNELKLSSDISNFFIIIVAFFFQTHSVIVT